MDFVKDFADDCTWRLLLYLCKFRAISHIVKLALWRVSLINTWIMMCPLTLVFTLVDSIITWDTSEKMKKKTLFYMKCLVMLSKKYLGNLSGSPRYILQNNVFLSWLYPWYWKTFNLRVFYLYKILLGDWTICMERFFLIRSKIVQ